MDNSIFDKELTQETAALLNVLSRRSPQSEDEIEKGLSKILDLESASIFEMIQEAQKNLWIEKDLYGWKLTDNGAKIYAEGGAAVSTEEEDIGPVDHPLKPYDVAKLKVEQKPLSVFQALRKIEKGEIVLDPEFQRAFVWDEVRQSRLIESILVRIPLPAFYLDATDQVKWSVVDGLQRLTTLYRFCRQESFYLSGLEFLTELSGMKFSELPQKYQVLIEDDTQLIFNNLLPGTPIKAKFTIFSRVNTGGMQLTPQEIRHALQQGPITKILRQLTSKKEFKKCTGGAFESLRMTDREVTLRALSFMVFGYDNYKEHDDLDTFLINSMEKFNLKFSKISLNEIALEFTKSILKVHAIFGRYSFRKYYYIGGRRSPVNKALFEAWIYAVKNYPIETLKDKRLKIQEEFIERLNNDENFLKSISSSTGQHSAVIKRFSTILDILRTVIND
ncbi:MAG: DUF262 domain-containing protein [Desulfomonilaceae bacterium]